jgi:hypothetical protein
MSEYGAMAEWYLQDKTERLEKKSCPSATLSTISNTWTVLGVNPNLRLVSE